jgi:alpha-glucuronidase
MDRTVATGTGFVGQYPTQTARVYESLDACPDELLLFFHHVPYTHRLHSGKTVIQSIYDSHYEGAEQAADFWRQWRTVRSRIDDQRFAEVSQALEYQAGHAIVWRDAICRWFLKMSSIPDDQGRAGHYPNRIEAETMTLSNYVIVDIKPWEAASGDKAIVCAKGASNGSATINYQGDSGRFDLAIQYFDQNNGAAQFRCLVNRKVIDAWVADRRLPGIRPNADTSTRRTIRNVALNHGDEVRIEGTPDGGDTAALDYLELNRSH